MRSAWVSALEGDPEFSVVPRSRVLDVARARGDASLASTESLLRVAEDLDLSAYLSGAVRRARRSWTLTVRVRNGRDGEELLRRSVTRRTTTALIAAQRGFFREVRSTLTNARSPIPTPPLQDAPPEEPLHGVPSGPSPHLEADPGRNPAWVADPQRQGAEPLHRDAPGNVPGPRERTSSDDPAPPPTSRDPNDYSWLELTLLGGTQFRSLQGTAIVTNDCSPSAGPGCREQGGTPAIAEAREYQSDGIGHGQIGGRLQFFPGAIGEQDSFPWLGVVLEARTSVLLSTERCRVRARGFDPCGTDDVFDLSTQQTELYGGLRLRKHWAEVPGVPELYADVGYGMFSFAFDYGQLQTVELQSVVPPMRYSYLQLGAGLSWGIVPPYFRLGLRGSYRLGFSVGQEAQEVWGRDTGGATGLGLGVDLISEAPYLVDGLFFQVSVDFFRFSTEFRGQTQCAFLACIPGTDPWERWPTETGSGNVIGGLREPVDDEYLQVSLAAGYRFY